MDRRVISQVSIGVSDMARARAFYGAALAPIGVTEQYNKIEAVRMTGSAPLGGDLT
jgi:catechol 2,3-dioxygenase-like lactoylglutathione lyase family enzyme